MENVKNHKKTLQELTFKDNFMFAAVMLNPDIAKGVLERILDQKIDHVEVSTEKSIVYNPEYKGIRLDVYLKDANNTRFNVEMQVANQRIEKRARYYHSQIDMELLESGIGYEALPKAYVIFICDFDPIGLGKYKYTLLQKLKEDEGYEYDDGNYTIFLSTIGTNDGEVSKDLVNFLHFTGANLEESQKEFSDGFVSKLQQSVNQIKVDREMGRRFMLMEEIRRQEFQAGKLEGKIEMIQFFLSNISPVPEYLSEKIASIESSDLLSELCVIASKASSLEEFEKQLDAMKI